MATKPASKAAPKLAAPVPGKCRRVINGKRHMAAVPTDHPNWTWCRPCVTAVAAEKRAASPSKPKAAKPKAKARDARLAKANGGPLKVAPDSGGEVQK